MFKNIKINIFLKMFSSPPSSQENLKVVSKRRGTVFQNEHHPSIQLGDKVNK